MMNKMIHYCWFGEGPKSATIEKCIESWKKYFPGWKLCEWNEENFDVHCNLYVEQAYEAKKWAFVADYCRFWALEKYGGIYFDTDVEVIRSFEPLLQDESFSGFETDKFIAPGLVLYSGEPGNALIKATREYYDSAIFFDENGERIKINVCGIFTGILKKYGFQENGEKQICGGMILYPKDYFCPFDDATGLLHKTENTYSIHWYDKSWMSKGRIFRNRCTRILHRIFGVDIKDKILGIMR
jgi:hypothetical protein